ncbi:MAG: hypothetical protein IPN19_11385 [Elusimicrobia bacterium]|nr:hypothetical protein [Elusimicrobiota bacterium]
MSEVNLNTVEIPEIKEVVVNTKPTLEEVKGRGWSKDEIEKAAKFGLIDKAEQKKEEPVNKEEVKENVAKEEVKVEEKPEKKVVSGLPEINLTAEQEKALAGVLPPGDPIRGMYFRMKNERTARQRLEAELEKAKTERAALEARLNQVPQAQTEEEGDPDDKPLTVRALRELRLREIEEENKRQADVNSRASAVVQAQQAQEEYAKHIYKDFDVVVGRARDVIKNLNSINEPWKRAKAVKLFNELQHAAANADSLGLDDYNGAMIAYEIGQLHPDHGTSAELDGEVLKPEPKVNGGLTPEKMKRIEENTQRRASSASVSGGGGRRMVTAEDVTLADLSRMDTRQRLTFREKHPEQYARLLRG